MSPSGKNPTTKWSTQIWATMPKEELPINFDCSNTCELGVERRQLHKLEQRQKQKGNTEESNRSCRKEKCKSEQHICQVQPDVNHSLYHLQRYQVYLKTLSSIDIAQVNSRRVEC
jgi:hypothetical protein